MSSLKLNIIMYAICKWKTCREKKQHKNVDLNSCSIGHELTNIINRDEKTEPRLLVKSSTYLTTSIKRACADALFICEKIGILILVLNMIIRFVLYRAQNIKKSNWKLGRKSRRLGIMGG